MSLVGSLRRQTLHAQSGEAVVRRSAMPQDEVDKRRFNGQLLADAQRRGLLGPQATVDDLDNPNVLRRLFDAWEQEAVRRQASAAKAKRDREQYEIDHPGIYADERSEEERRDTELRARTLQEGAEYDGELLTNRQLRQRRASEELVQTLSELESSPLSALFLLCSKPKNYSQAAHLGAAVWGLIQVGAEIANPSTAYHPSPTDIEQPAVEGPAVAGANNANSARDYSASAPTVPQPTRTEPARTEPARTEPAQTEPAPTQPAASAPVTEGPSANAKAGDGARGAENSPRPNSEVNDDNSISVTYKDIVGDAIEDREGTGWFAEPPGSLGLKDYVVAHMWGPGFGLDLPDGAMYAHRDINSLQNTTVEARIRSLHKFAKSIGGQVELTVRATSHPRKPGQPVFLREIEYHVEVRDSSGALTPAFEATIGGIGLPGTPTSRRPSELSAKPLKLLHENPSILLEGRERKRQGTASKTQKHRSKE